MTSLHGSFIHRWTFHSLQFTYASQKSLYFLKCTLELSTIPTMVFKHCKFSSSGLLFQVSGETICPESLKHFTQYKFFFFFWNKMRKSNFKWEKETITRFCSNFFQPLASRKRDFVCVMKKDPWKHMIIRQRIKIMRSLALD